MDDYASSVRRPISSTDNDIGIYKTAQSPSAKPNASSPTLSFMSPQRRETLAGTPPSRSNPFSVSSSPMSLFASLAAANTRSRQASKTDAPNSLSSSIDRNQPLLRSPLASPHKASSPASMSTSATPIRHMILPPTSPSALSISLAVSRTHSEQQRSSASHSLNEWQQPGSNSSNSVLQALHDLDTMSPNFVHSVESANRHIQPSPFAFSATSDDEDDGSLMFGSSKPRSVRSARWSAALPIPRTASVQSSIPSSFKSSLYSPSALPSPSPLSVPMSPLSPSTFTQFAAASAELFDADLLAVVEQLSGTEFTDDVPLSQYQNSSLTDERVTELQARAIKSVSSPKASNTTSLQLFWSYVRTQWRFVHHVPVVRAMWDLHGVPDEFRCLIWPLALREWYSLSSASTMLLSADPSDQQWSSYLTPSTPTSNTSLGFTSPATPQSPASPAFAGSPGSESVLTRASLEADIARMFFDAPPVFDSLIVDMCDMLSAYDRYCAQAGLADDSQAYVQGSSYVAAMLLLHVPDRIAALRCFHYVLSLDAVSAFVRFDAECMNARFEMFGQTLRFHAKHVAAWLADLQITPDMFLIEWYITLFCRVLPLPFAACVWDRLLCRGEQALLQFACALVIQLHTQVHQTSETGESTSIKQSDSAYVIRALQHFPASCLPSGPRALAKMAASIALPTAVRLKFDSSGRVRT